MEAVKDFVFSRGTQNLERKKVHSYLVSFVIMSVRGYIPFPHQT